MSRHVEFSPPCIGEEEIAAVVEAMRSGWLSAGPKVQEFEAAFVDYLGAEGGHAVSSCTAALHLALSALGLGPGDAVAAPSLTFCSTVNVIEQVGAYPILLDVDPATLTLDPAALQRFLDHTADNVIEPDHPYFGRGDRRAPGSPLELKAVLPVHFGGLPADTASLDRIAKKNSLLLVEDAAHALPSSTTTGRIGATRPTGLPHATCFSFYATKNLSTGEGGFVSGPPDLVERAKGMSLHGMTTEAWQRYTNPSQWSYDVPVRGYKYNMTDPAAALGLVQLARLDSMWERRRSLALRYAEGLAAQLPETVVPAQDHSVSGHAHHIFVVRLLSSEGPTRPTRTSLMRALAEAGVSTSVHFRPVHSLSYYKDRLPIDPHWLAQTDRAADTILSLPLHPGMSDDDVDYVLASLYASGVMGPTSKGAT